MIHSARSRVRRAATAAAACGPLLIALFGPAAVAGAADAGATVTVSKATGLVEGGHVTVTGEGFRPGLTSVAVGLCKKGYRDNKDCDLTGGAALVNIDAHGRLPKVTLTVHRTVAGADCRTTPCVVGVSPLPAGTPASLRPPNTVDIPIGLKGGTVTGEPSGVGHARTAAAGTGGSGSGWDGPSTGLWTACLSVVVLCAGLSRFPLRPKSFPLSRSGGTT
ncbi:neocarzinostatin apoprotein domain-containing protein [Streptomyces sp. NPDC050529]|uniref:neocarzinostatin apoprotein domain-containing protein n=1 Tax=Streptomyces sp. NPDC050529 TaxID=3365624 RepID=UPI003791EEE0